MLKIKVSWKAVVENQKLRAACATVMMNMARILDSQKLAKGRTEFQELSKLREWVARFSESTFTLSLISTKTNPRQSSSAQTRASVLRAGIWTNTFL